MKYLKHSNIHVNMFALCDTLNRLQEFIQRLEGQAEITQWEQGADELYKEKDYIKNREIISELHRYLKNLKTSPINIQNAGYDSIELSFLGVNINISHKTEGFKVIYKCFNFKPETYIYNTVHLPELMRIITHDVDSIMISFYKIKQDKLAQLYQYIRSTKIHSFNLNYAGPNYIALTHVDGIVEIRYKTGKFKVYYSSVSSNNEECEYDTQDPSKLMETIKEKCNSMHNDIYLSELQYL